ncbi:hypothetical protein BDZ97DRAFT_1920004 [Flammula alnicola]|nr:hypothetical protein BDZ97DRAFT_1920004 [Flammula alnicola]
MLKREHELVTKESLDWVPLPYGCTGPPLLLKSFVRATVQISKVQAFKRSSFQTFKFSRKFLRGFFLRPRPALPRLTSLTSYYLKQELRPPIPEMANLASKVPIFKLHIELLSEIFSATMVLPPPHHDFDRFNSSLKTSRRSSQVCSHWQEIILRQSILWGSCIDFTALEQEKGDWREEVLRRTGNSLLSISAIMNVTRYPPGLRRHFDFHELWHACARPTPHLKSFEFSPLYLPPPDPAHALVIPITPPGHHAPLGVMELLEALTRMPPLETLVVALKESDLTKNPRYAINAV